MSLLLPTSGAHMQSQYWCNHANICIQMNVAVFLRLIHIINSSFMLHPHTNCFRYIHKRISTNIVYFWNIYSELWGPHLYIRCHGGTKSAIIQLCLLDVCKMCCKGQPFQGFYYTKQSGRSPKVVAFFSVTNYSYNILELRQLHDAIKIKCNYVWIHYDIAIRSHLMIYKYV